MSPSARVRRKFDDNFKLDVVQEFLSGSLTLYGLCKKYCLRSSVLHRWIRTFAPEYQFNESPMGKKPRSQSEELLALERALRQKELELKREKMRADFYETMVDIAKEDFNIDLRKKAGTKQ